jgi:protein TonB
MEGGVEGGVVGGLPGGVLGGVIGGTGRGTVPVVERDYDRPPRPIRMTRPVYPQEAFVKKVEGTVLLELLIDANGQVVRARVLQSVPLLDDAALEAVGQWLFAPAVKHGRPVATVAQAPISFRIY